MIRIEGLCKSYGTETLEVKVLRDINLSIAEGEFVAIMGPSGSGKSTLLYLMGGLDRPTRGRIHVADRDLAQMSDIESSILRRRNIGFVFQFYNLIPNLSVEENIMLPLMLDGKKIRKNKEILNELLETVELSHRRTHTPNELSGGEQQRVAVARALICDPEVILADEPTGNLDSRAGKAIMELLSRVHIQKQKTIVMVTHSKTAAVFAERVIRMRDGRVHTDDEPGDAT